MSISPNNGYNIIMMTFFLSLWFGRGRGSKDIDKIEIQKYNCDIIIQQVEIDMLISKIDFYLKLDSINWKQVC